MTAIQEQAIKTEPFDDLIALIIEQEVMLSVILEAHSKIRALFPTERLALEVKTDPEIANWRSLWITIYTKLEVDEALEKLQNLDRTWWLDAGLVISQNKLNIDLGWE
ncbi:MAG: peptidase [Microcoleus sp. PH2017_17_BER_D_A]|nr:peptidase [Microcoleus sp. PH2017_17_BER_D_A]